VKRVSFPLSLSCLLGSFLLLPVVKAGEVDHRNNAVVVTSVSATKSNSARTAEEAAISLYSELNLEAMGMNQQALVNAYKGHQKLVEEGKVPQDDILTVCDFSQPSDRKRMYIIDVANQKVLVNTYVAHGKNSGLQRAERFSNRHESLQSSLGFYVTKGTYFGKHGLSLKLDGLERGFNDNAESRAVVVHGANYIGENRLGSAYMGRSFGCPAVPQAQANKIINLIKNGTTLFIYSPNQQYLHGSTILNG
jgi:hypothetical protein